MNNVLILLDNPDDWKPYCETKSILTVSDFFFSFFAAKII